MRKVLTPEETAERDRKAAALSEEARLNWKNVQWHNDMAAILNTEITKGFETENVVDLFAELRRVGNDDRVTLTELAGLRVYQLARGGYIQESTVEQKIFDVTRDTYGWGISEFEDKMEANFGVEINRLKALGQARVAQELNSIVLKTFQSAVSVGDPNYTSAAGFTLGTLNTALRAVKDESDTGEIAIIGRSTMTQKIMDELVALNGGSYAAYLHETNEELLRRGAIGTYRGANIVELKNFKDDIGRSFFPGNELWVVARDASLFALWGSPKEKEFVEPDNWFWHFKQRFDFGGLVYRPLRLWRIVDTTEDV